MKSSVSFESPDKLSWTHGMNTLADSKNKPLRGFVPTTALAKAVSFADDMMHVALTDGRVRSVPVIWFPILHRATMEKRNRFEIGGGGVSLHWPEIDEDLSIAGLMAGVDRAAG
jgi:hypothetical protein